VGRRGLQGVIVGLVGLASVAGVQAAPPGPAPRAPEVMLFFSHSMGGGAGGVGGHPTFGLRVQQIRQGGNNGDPEAGDPMQHHEWLSVQMNSRADLHFSDMRLKLGNRLTYDVSNRRFGAPPSRSAMQLGSPSLRNGSAASQPLRASAFHSPTPTLSPREAAESNSALREIAASAISAVAPARFSGLQRIMAQQSGGIRRGPAGALPARRTARMDSGALPH
jgi:hypothetical protein